VNTYNKIEILLMGAMKSGTTWLSSIIALSEELSFIPFKVDSQFTSDSIAAAINTNNPDSFKKYGRMNMKVNPHLAEIFKTHNPNIKIVVLLRNPITRTFSNFVHYVNKESRLDWNYYNDAIHMHHPIKNLIHPGAVKKIKNKIIFDINIDIEKRGLDYINKSPGWIKKSCYYDLLKPYFNIMKNENILICRYEDIYLSPHKLIKEICDFLDVQINNKMLGLSSSVINPTKTKKNIKDLINFSKTKECIELSENSINFLNDIYISDVEKLSKQEKFDFVNFWALKNK
jgi:hypothetical protein